MVQFMYYIRDVLQLCSYVQLLHSTEDMLFSFTTFWRSRYLKCTPKLANLSEPLVTRLCALCVLPLVADTNANSVRYFLITERWLVDSSYFKLSIYFMTKIFWHSVFLCILSVHPAYTTFSLPMVVQSFKEKQLHTWAARNDSFSTGRKYIKICK